MLKVRRKPSLTLTERRRRLIRERLLQLSYDANLLVRIVKLEFPALPIRSDKVSVLLSIIVNKHSNV